MRNPVLGDRLIALFLLGVLLLTPPMMTIFNVDRLVFGIPLLFLYLFVVWILIVILVAVILSTRQEPSGADSPPDDGG